MTTSRNATTARRSNRAIAPVLTMLVGVGLAGTAIFAGTALLPAASIAQTSVDAEDFYLAVVTGNDVYVRSGGADSYYPFGKVSRGDVVKVIGEKHSWARVLTTGPAFRDFFAYVRYPSSDEGRFQLDETGRKGRTLGRTRALAPNLNTNYEPDDSWKRILLIEADVEVEVLETTKSERAVVHKIVMPQNAEGWISTAFLKPATSREITAWESSIERAKLLASGALTPQAQTQTQTRAEPAPRPLGAAGPGYQGAPVTGETTEAAFDTTPEPALETAFDTTTDTATDATIGATTDAMTAAMTAPPAVLARETEFMPMLPPPTEVVVSETIETTQAMHTELEAPVTRHELVEWPVKASPPLPTPEVTYEAATIEPAPTPEPDFGEVSIDETPVVSMQPATIERTMPKPVAPPSPFDRISAAIRNKTPKDALADLEAAYQKLRSEPIETAEVLPLRHLYRSLASASTDDREVARYADARAEQLSIWADLQQRRSELEQLRTRLKLTAEEAEAARLSLEQSGTYAAVGRLTVSTVYDGVRLPRLYRVQDPVTGRTIVYLKPDDSFDLPAMIGQVIGIIGRQSFEEKLRLKLVEARRIDLLAQAQSG